MDKSGKFACKEMNLFWFSDDQA